MNDSVSVVAEYQRKLFNILDEFFVRATGRTAPKFSSIEGFSEEIKKTATANAASRAYTAFSWLGSELRALYGHESGPAFSAAKHLGGMRLVLGGGSRLNESHLKTVQGMALFSDTVLVPDPVMPWVEIERTEEQFRHVLLLQAVHALLQLKPLVDANLPYPPVVVFPSWEKGLEEHDSNTQDGIRSLVVDLFSHYVGEPFATFEELRDRAIHTPDQLIAAIETHSLFVAPGGEIGEPLPAALARYDEEMSRWRTKEWCSRYSSLPPALRLLSAVWERIAPQYHLIENAEELGAQPLIAIEQQSHYFTLLSRVNSARLERLGILQPRTAAAVKALGSKSLEWIRNVSIQEIVTLRADGEHLGFRARIERATQRLHDSLVDDTDRVAAEITYELSNALAEHDKAVRAIEQKYARLHGQTLASTAAAAGAVFLPSLAPQLGAVAPLALATKYVWDKISQRAEQRTVAKSLVGVLAMARQKRVSPTPRSVDARTLTKR